MIEFEILKKGHISPTTKAGLKRSKDTLIRMRSMKKPKTLLLPIDDELFELLCWYIDTYNLADDERLFQFSRWSANRFLQKACKEKKIRLSTSHNPHVHMFRHSFSIHFLQKNQKNPAALSIVKKLLDHSRMDITETYLQFSQEDTREMINKTWKGE